MQDREPTYPGRVIMTPVFGQANAYDMERADKPLQQGTPLNKATLLKDATAALYGLGTGAVPDDVLAELGKYKQYWWARRSVNAGWYQVNTTATNRFLKYDQYDTVVYTYGDSISVSQTDGTITINSASSMTLRRSTVTVDKLAVLKGKYFKTDLNQSGHIIAGDIYFVPTDAVITRDYDSDSGQTNYRTSALIHVTTEYRSTIGNWEYLQSSNRSAYPDIGLQDGYEYKYLGIPFDNAVTAPKIESGSYVGTGTYGYTNKNSLTVPFSPVLLLISDGKRGFAVIPMAGENGVAYFGTTQATWSVTRDGNTISWYMSYGNHSDGSTWSDSADGQMNTSNTTYYYFAFG